MYLIFCICSGGVVRPIISAFRAEDSGSNPGRSIFLYLNKIIVHDYISSWLYIIIINIINTIKFIIKSYIITNIFKVQGTYLLLIESGGARAAKGDRLRTCWRRSTRVRIPAPASFFKGVNVNFICYQCRGGVGGYPTGLWILRLGFESRPRPHFYLFFILLINIKYWVLKY